MPGKTRPRSDLLCVERDLKLYSLTHIVMDKCLWLDFCVHTGLLFWLHRCVCVSLICCFLLLGMCQCLLGPVCPDFCLNKWIWIWCSYHNSLHRLLHSTCQSLTGLARVLLSLSDVQSVQISHRQFSTLMKKTSGCEKICSVIEPYTTLFTPYCCNLIADEMCRASNELFSVSEVCIALQLQTGDCCCCCCCCCCCWCCCCCCCTFCVEWCWNT